MSTTNSSSTQKPAIIAPVMRFLRVSDTDRSLAFYRDVLGFEVRPVQHDYGFPAVAEVASGEARIQIGDKERVQRQIVFLDTDNIEAMREAVVARGGEPSALEKVNWIKMEMFEIRDPDGHTLWFGQSFDGPDVPRPDRMMRTIMPEMPLDDVTAGVAYYRDILGFTVNYAQHDFGVMDRDKVRVLLIARTSRHTGIGSCYLYVNDADALHAELCARGANVQGEPVSQPWGLREFYILDLEGNRIGFGQPFE
jgi:predicted enzyme related to lactoylglutathione lyase